MTEPTTKSDLILERVKRYIQADEKDIINNEVRPSITFYTDDSPEVPRLIVMPEMDGSDQTRNQIAWSLRLIAAAIDNLDCIAFASDTYVHKSTTGLDGKPVLGIDGEPLKPTKLDGSDWGPGEMQEAWHNNTPDKALISEAYTYNLAYNDGTFAMVSVPYVVDQAAGTVEFDWDDVTPFVTEDGGRAGGFFPEAMFRALTETKMVDAMIGIGLDETAWEQFGLEKWQARLHTVAVAVKMVMKETGWSCMIPSQNEEEAQVVKDSFDGGPFTEGIRAYDQDQIAEIGALEDQFDQPAVGTPEWLAGLQGSVE